METPLNMRVIRFRKPRVNIMLSPKALRTLEERVGNRLRSTYIEMLISFAFNAGEAFVQSVLSTSENIREGRQQRINVTIAPDILAKLQERIPTKSRSAFIEALLFADIPFIPVESLTISDAPLPTGCFAPGSPAHP